MFRVGDRFVFRNRAILLLNDVCQGALRREFDLLKQCIMDTPSLNLVLRKQ
jgi:hypothetical protein